MTQSIEEYLVKSGLFHDFPEDIKIKIAAHSHIQSFRDGEVVYQVGDTSLALYGIIEGAIKVFSEDNFTGKYYMLGILSPGHWFGEISALDGKPREQRTLAAGNTKVISLQRNYLLELLSSKPELYLKFVTVLCLRLRLSGRVMQDTLLRRIDARMARNLLLWDGIRRKHNIKLSQEELAASLGVTRQTTYPVIKDWNKKGWVSIGYGNINVENVDALRGFLEKN